MLLLGISPGSVGVHARRCTVLSACLLSISTPGFCVCLAFPGAAPVPPRAPSPDLAPCHLLSFSGSSYLWGVLYAIYVSLVSSTEKVPVKARPRQAELVAAS